LIISPRRTDLRYKSGTDGTQHEPLPTATDHHETARHGSARTHLPRWDAVHQLPLTHLDVIYYDAEWHEPSQEEFGHRQRELAGRPRWLIEGNYASTLPIRLAAADTVIFLDLPAVACLLGILQRRWRYCGGQHANDGVFDRISFSFVRYIWGYRQAMRPKVERLIAEHGGHARLATLTSRRQSTRFVHELPTATQAQG
jgi:adenylate kinase family enzyme